MKMENKNIQDKITDIENQFIQLNSGIKIKLTNTKPDCPITNCKNYGTKPDCYFQMYQSCPIYKIHTIKIKR